MFYVAFVYHITIVLLLNQALSRFQMINKKYSYFAEIIEMHLLLTFKKRSFQVTDYHTYLQYCYS